jgi:hypothetical protein
VDLRRRSRGRGEADDGGVEGERQRHDVAGGVEVERPGPQGERRRRKWRPRGEHRRGQWNDDDAVGVGWHRKTEEEKKEGGSGVGCGWGLGMGGCG